MKKLSLIGLAIASAVMLSTERSLAHSVQTDYLLSPDSGLSIDVTFSSGEPLAEAPVKVYSPDNPTEPWMEGTTDENGKFSFLPDKKMQGEWTVKIGEYNHADILSVPVDKKGIEIDDISQRETGENQLAQLPLKIKTAPAQASSVSLDEAHEPFLWALLPMAMGVGLTATALHAHKLWKK